MPVAGDVDDRVRDALEATGWPVYGVDVSISPRAYFDLLFEYWADGATFTVIEHDMVVHATALEELDACPYEWCAFPYRYGTHERHYGLGCAKFGEELIARNPDAMRRVGTMRDMNHPARHWCRLDAWLQGVVLPGSGEHMHRHERSVRHLGCGNSHGCIPS